MYQSGFVSLEGTGIIREVRDKKKEEEEREGGNCTEVVEYDPPSGRAKRVREITATGKEKRRNGSS